MTIQDRILDYLQKHPEGIDDDALTVALNLAQRQQANQRCRRLEQFGFITRRRVDGKIRNFFNSAVSHVPAKPPISIPEINERPWYWEGNVQARVVEHIQGLGYRIASIADTASKQRGKDVIASAPSGEAVWISAKGYPVGTVRTNPRIQARHWFAHALFDLILWHGEDSSVVLALALPDQVTYRNLANRSGWFLAKLDACIFWVDSNGKVTKQAPTKALSNAAGQT